MFKFRVPVYIFQNYRPSLVQNRAVLSGFHGKESRRVLKYGFDQHNKIKTDPYRGILQCNQQRSSNNITFNFAEKQTGLINSYRMYSTYDSEEKKIPPKNINKVRKVVSSKPELESSRLQRITILDKSVTKPDVSISTVIPILIQSPLNHNVIPIIDQSSSHSDVLKKDPQKPIVLKSNMKFSQDVKDKTESQPVTLQKESQQTIPKKNSKTITSTNKSQSVTFKPEAQPVALKSPSQPDKKVLDYNPIHDMVLYVYDYLYVRLMRKKGELLYTATKQNLSNPKTYNGLLNFTRISFTGKVSVSSTKTDEGKDNKSVVKAKETTKQMEYYSFSDKRKGLRRKKSFTRISVTNKESVLTTETDEGKDFKKSVQKAKETTERRVYSFGDKRKFGGKIKGLLATLNEMIDNYIKKK